ncbi:formylglycine-generating enzyme family protein [Nocardioides alcanivorans]|uniref:formylglycine-generating enzyme family protein n=1 Tax=Nocardioides alcanivorans TaxID=2897352 RepID=UPI001F186343|nr:formylglycine-generating enzyme family protein [Nocardioides alcanivorans]
MTGSEPGGCCSPSRPTSNTPATLPAPSRRRKGGPAQALVPGGTFAMGDHFDEGYPADGETPVHEVELHPFRIDPVAVTNAAFSTFVKDTGYVTVAEREGFSAVFHLALSDPDAVRGAVAGAQWWLMVDGADWRHPEGPSSDVRDRSNHPVVHVSHTDAEAYATWAGRRLPTEAEWEYAARGGLAGQRFVWGEELTPGGRHRCNIWQGDFPVRNTEEDGWLTTAPVKTFPPNGYGLHQMAGNVWEWCADWFAADYYTQSPHQDPRGPDEGVARVMRGGSFLCHDSYCHRYRVAARSSNTPDSSSANIGFRCASDV